MRKAILTLAAVAAIGAAGNASAAALYSGGTYLQDFDDLPHGTHNGITIQYNNSAYISNGNTPFPGGWRDDFDFDNDHLGIKGWYLWHAANLSNGGFTGHAGVRYGNASPTTPSSAFYIFTTGASSTSSNIDEKALGIVSSNALNGDPNERTYIGLQLVNNTGQTLDSFTITYDGEQYRDRGTAGENGFDLQWSLVTTAAGWKSSDVNEIGGFYDGVSGVDYGGFANSFVPPQNGAASAVIDGNVVYDPLLAPEGGAIRDITHTVTGINWEPGAELWIRWRDQITPYDGFAIDNVRFSATAVPEPATLVMAGLGLAAVGLLRRKR